MKKRNTIISIFGVWVICIMALSTTGCLSDSKTTSNEETKDTIMPLNISVYLDLSDRLTRNLNPTQMERDTAIINHLIDIFISDCINNGKILNSKNHFQVLFYPAPNSSQIAQLAKSLNVDLSKTELKRKKVELMEMKTRFQTNLSQIYDDAMEEGKWVGSDIWGFFSNKEVDKLCVRDGYRNLLVILTDGYLFHADNKVKEGNTYSYVLPQTLEIADASLIVKRRGLSNIEVLMLEVNPYNPKQRDKLTSILENWFRDMEVGKFVVSETALPVNTEVYIDSFLND